MRFCPRQEYRIKGEEVFDQNDWTKVIEWIEIATKEYYQEEERCRVECEDHFNHQSAVNFIQAIAGKCLHYYRYSSTAT